MPRNTVSIVDQVGMFTTFERPVCEVEVGDGSILYALRQWRGPEFCEFEGPTVVFHNGEPTLRSSWSTPGVVKEGDLLNIIPLPAAQAIVVIFYVVMIAAVAYAVYVSSKAPKLQSPGEAPQADPIYSLGAEKNTSKLGQPIEVGYGRNRIYPSYAARPFNRYIDGEQYLYQLFCIGQGSYDVHGVYIEDSVIEGFRDVTYQIYPPGQQASLFPDNVVTAVEVANLELFGTNETLHTTYGPYTLNPPGTVTDLIEVDIALPNGLYKLDNEGNVKDLSVSMRFEVRMLDDLDQPISDWTYFDQRTLTYRSVNPVRLTISHSVVAGRYQIRGLRTNAKDTSSRAANTLTWETARAFLPNTRDYGDVTLLAVAMKATNNLNSNSQNRVNVVCTRRIPVWDGSKWVTRASRSVMWAAADVLRSQYGARLTQQYLDLPKMRQIDQLLAARGDFFDYVFTQKTTIWEALRTITQVGRVEPLLLGPKFTFTRDEPKTVPVGVFTPDNIVEGTFEWDIEYFDPLEYDSVEVTYIDTTTWKEMVVMCVPPGSNGVNPQRIKLHGVSDRAQAYHEGMFRALANLRRRETISFTTGMEGVIPLRGDLVAVSFDLPSWGRSGVLFDIGLDNRTLYLDDDMDWVPGITYHMLLRLDDGSAFGPFPVTKGTVSRTAIAATNINPAMFSDVVGREPILYLFGPVDRTSRLCLVQEAQPQGGERVLIKAINYDNAVYNFDNAAPPAVDAGSVPPKVPDLPEVPYLTALPVPGNLRQVMASWGVALGARSYVLQKSLDGNSWSTVVTTVSNNFTLDVDPGELFLRVCAINVGAGEWVVWNGTVGVPSTVPSVVPGLALAYPFTGLQASLQWSSVYEAEFYRVRVYDEWDDLLMTATTEATSFVFDFNDAYGRNIVRRRYRFRVVGVNGLGESPVPSTIEAYNPPPPKITSASVVATGETSTEVTYRGSWNRVTGTDIKGYLVWASPTPGFTPSGSNLVFNGLATAVDIKVPKNQDGSVPVYYWRVAAVDYWGDEYTPSDEMSTV